ncbi:MAG: mycofactocin biosynthesis chaperone MftB [Nocardioidaceae bacterium]
MLDQAWRLGDSVELRPEPFGALAYDFRTRRLAFLKTSELAHVARRLGTAGTPRVGRLVDRLERMQVFHVNIGGGEPTVRPDFWELLDHAVAFRQVWQRAPLFQELRSPQTGGACRSCSAYDSCRGGCLAAKFCTRLPLDGPDRACDETPLAAGQP